MLCDAENRTGTLVRVEPKNLADEIVSPQSSYERIVIGAHGVETEFPTGTDIEHLAAFVKALSHGSLPIRPRGAKASAIIYSLMETAKANHLRLDDYLLHLLSALPERAERSKNFEIDDLLPWSKEMKTWFSEP